MNNEQERLEESIRRAQIDRAYWLAKIPREIQTEAWRMGRTGTCDPWTELRYKYPEHRRTCALVATFTHAISELKGWLEEARSNGQPRNLHLARFREHSE